MIQTFIIALLFVAASVWLGRKVWLSFTAKNCENGCGSCSVDWKAIEEKAKAEMK